MALPRRAITTVTPATAPLHEGNPTGMFVSEALHPFQVFRKAGFEVDHCFLLPSCHGAAIFPGVIDVITGKSVAAGKSITGFTTQGEYDMHLMDTIRPWNEPIIDEWAEKLGGKCVSFYSIFISLGA
jgi:putative intracellular protease/amidase